MKDAVRVKVRALWYKNVFGGWRVRQSKEL